MSMNLHQAIRSLSIPVFGKVVKRVRGASPATLVVVAATALYAGTARGGVFKSTNGGDDWSATALTNTHVNALVIDPADPSTLYAVANGAVYKSTNGGANWNATGPTDLDVYSLAIGGSRSAGHATDERGTSC